MSVKFGKPVRLDVKALEDAYPDLAVGDEVDYSAIRKVLGMKYFSIERDRQYSGHQVDEMLREHDRFRTVTESWRKKMLREKNFRVEPTGEGAFVRLSEEERSSNNAKRGLRTVKRLGRLARDQSLVDTTRMNETSRKSVTHVREVLNRTAEHAYSGIKELAPPRPPRQLPKSSPIE